MALSILPDVFMTKMVDYCNYDTLKNLRVTSKYYYNRVQKFTNFIQKSKASYNFIHFNYRSCKKYFKFIKKHKIDTVEFQNFQYCNEYLLKKIKLHIKKSVKKLIIKKFESPNVHIKLLLQSLTVREVIFQDCHTYFLTGIEASTLSKKYLIFDNRIFQFYAQNILFNDCSKEFIEDFFNSNIMAAVSRNITIKRDTSKDPWFINISKMVSNIESKCPFLTKVKEDVFNNVNFIQFNYNFGV
jgi:hypothetical protein